MPHNDFSSMLSCAQQAARDAGQLLRDNFEGDFKVSEKGYINYVTELDVRAEQAILARITGAFPDHGFVSEETGESKRNSPYNWIIDPLDGTTNYAHGYPAFGVSIALEFEGRLVLGVIYDPMSDELFWATEGQGSFRNGRPIRVSRRSTLVETLLATGFSYEPELLRRNLHFFGEFMQRASGVRRDGSAARDLSYVACGRFDAVWEIGLKPWDQAAGILLVREAGGTVTDFQGNPGRPDTKELLFSNGLLDEQLLEVLNQGPADRLMG